MFEQLSLEKFGSIGGDYFEILIAIALEELGYVHTETYLASWDKKCVPGTWIEADFIIGPKKDPEKDPLRNCKYVLAVGHATSENSAQMKFHRDVEQLLEVKALPNGAEIFVHDILFCCPREAMGGWSKELVAINEAIFDDSLIVWKHDWGIRLLEQIQVLMDEFPRSTDMEVKKRKIAKLIDSHQDFRVHFNALKRHISAMLSTSRSNSQIQPMFKKERELLPSRLRLPLLVTSKEKTEYKRGLLQVLALNQWELELLYENYQHKEDQPYYPLEQLALSRGMTPEEFDRWWERLELLSFKIGRCWKEYPPDDELDPNVNQRCCFVASDELGFVFEHFDLAALTELVENIPTIAPNLVPYVLDLRDLGRVITVSQFLARSSPDEFMQICRDCYESDPWLGMPMPRLLVFEVAKAAIETEDKTYSYDVIAGESGNQGLINNPFTLRFLAGKKGSFENGQVYDGLKAVATRLELLPEHKLTEGVKAVTKQFIYDRFDGMVKQPKASVLDALIDSSVRNFAKSIGGNVTSATVRGIASAFNPFAETENAGVNVEVPYVVVLSRNKKVLIHRVMSDGGVGHKRKEFASKIRSIRYESDKAGRIAPRNDYHSSVLILDGNWMVPRSNDPLTHIRMLTAAGWDYVVYPDGISDAFKLIKRRLANELKIGVVEEEELPLAAERELKVALGRKAKRPPKPSSTEKI